MIKLIQFPPAWDQPNPSPFCTKAEILLKMANRPFEIISTPNPGNGPLGKLPAIEDGGKKVGDSEAIRHYLERTYKIDFDEGLSEVERSQSHAFCRLIEERFYWVLVYSRWIEPKSWPIVRNTFFSPIPPVIRSFVAAMARRQVRGVLRAQGLGRHSVQQIYAFGIDDLRAIAAQLDDKPFFMGDRPTSADATVHPFITGIADTPFDTPLRVEAQSHKNLSAYTARMKEMFFNPDS